MGYEVRSSGGDQIVDEVVDAEEQEEKSEDEEEDDRDVHGGVASTEVGFDEAERHTLLTGRVLVSLHLIINFKGIYHWRRERRSRIDL